MWLCMQHARKNFDYKLSMIFWGMDIFGYESFDTQLSMSAKSIFLIGAACGRMKHVKRWISRPSCHTNGIKAEFQKYPFIIFTMSVVDGAGAHRTYTYRILKIDRISMAHYGIASINMTHACLLFPQRKFNYLSAVHFSTSIKFECTFIACTAWSHVPLRFFWSTKNW